MIYRGRTVAAIIVLTAFASCAATIGALGLVGKPIWSSSSADGRAEPSASSNTPGTDGLSDAELGKLNKAVELIMRKYLNPVDRDKLLDGAIAGMVGSLGDPYSAYYSQVEAAKFSDSLEGAFSGIGARLDVANGQVIVERVMRSTPADRAGLKAGDVLMSVNGQSLQGLSLAEAVAKIRGPKGTKAKLTVQRSGTDGTVELELVRDRIVAETVSGDLDADGVGHLRITQFTFDTPQLVAQELKPLEDGGMKALVIDVRDNPGGVLTSVEAVAEQFIPSGRKIVIEEDSTGERKTSVAGSGKGKPYPIVVLINGGSASSSEILAGALKQSAGAKLVGATTYGKGTVQISYEDELGDGSLLKLTVMKWLLPDGTWINNEGIKPDEPVSQPDYFSASDLSGDHAIAPDETSIDVRNLQLMLEGVGLPADRVDGYFSPATAEAVKLFQKREKLAETGIVDTATAQKLEEALYDVLQDPQHDEQWKAARSIALELVSGG